MLSRMLQRDLFAPPQGGGNRDIDRDGSTDRDKEDNGEGESGHEEGIKEGRAGENDSDSEVSGLKEDSSSGSEGGDGAGADQEGDGSGDEEWRKDWVVCGVGDDSDSDRRKGSFCNGNQSEE